MNLCKGLASSAFGALLFAATMAPASEFVGPEGSAGAFAARDLEKLLRDNPLAPGENIKPIALQRSAHVLVQVRDREPVHYHADSDITVLMVRGAGTMHLGAQTVATKAGDTVFIPRGAVHYFVNAGTEPAAALVTYSPPPGPNDRVLVPPAR
jgi:mannose-6-phosphate isomerase-like protein (cupin superfamily)